MHFIMKYFSYFLRTNEASTRNRRDIAVEELSWICIATNELETQKPSQEQMNALLNCLPF